MADFTTDQMDTFRRTYLRDVYIAADPLADPPVLYDAYSSYNKANKAVFISDADINILKGRVEEDMADELLDLYNTDYATRINAGDDTVTATNVAADSLLQATMRLVRAEVFELMVSDPGFHGSFIDQTIRAQIVLQMKENIVRDRNFERQRSGGFGSVRLVRR